MQPDPAVPADGTGQLHVQADLTFSVDGQEGRVEADGPDVRVHTTDAAAVWDAALGGPTGGSSLLRGVADRLAEGGLTVHVSSPDGDVATVGAGVHSPLGRLVAGTHRVRLGSPKAVVPLARAQLKASLGASPRTVAAGALLALALGVLVRRSRR